MLTRILVPVEKRKFSLSTLEFILQFRFNRVDRDSRLPKRAFTHFRDRRANIERTRPFRFDVAQRRLSRWENVGVRFSI